MEIVNLEKKLKSDLKIIELDLICKLKDKKYCKYSRALGSVIATNLTEQQYISYWKSQYNGNEEGQKIIEKACKEKFKNGLISKEEMIELVKSSKDSTKDKSEALKKLGYKGDLSMNVEDAIKILKNIEKAVSIEVEHIITPREIDAIKILLENYKRS